jgi:hypothetical protein
MFGFALFGFKVAPRLYAEGYELRAGAGKTLLFAVAWTIIDITPPSSGMRAYTHAIHGLDFQRLRYTCPFAASRHR